MQTSKPTHRPILEVGRNCWRIEHAGRASCLIDGEAYFRAFREVAKQAQHAIIILGWDFDSRVKMLPAGESDGFPTCIGEFFHTLLARQRELHIYVLAWDYHMVYALEREWWPVYKLGTHRRLHFKMDDTHPAGASHHQKVVVVDDTVAFSGGLDFAQCRWDTPEHRPDLPQRVFPDGRPCRPFHDVQMMVNGDAAAALGELVRERWTRATGRGPVPRCSPRGGYWPSYLKPDLENVRVAIIIALQEVDSYNHRGLVLLDWFSEQMGLHAIPGPTLIKHTGHYGNALLTRLHVHRVRRLDLSFSGHEPRGAIDADLECGPLMLQVVATHLGLRPAERRFQIQRLLSRFSTTHCALLGDLNEWFLWGRPLRWLRKIFGKTPARPTFPAWFPIFALDRIWVHPVSALISFDVHKSLLARIASDHLPLKAVIEF